MGRVGIFWINDHWIVDYGIDIPRDMFFFYIEDVLYCNIENRAFLSMAPVRPHGCVIHFV